MIERKKEVEELTRLYERNSAELVAIIYGRRRVGKTFPVDDVFGSRITDYHIRTEEE